MYLLTVRSPEDRMKRRLRLILGVVLLAVAGFGFVQWREGTRHGGQQPAEPFRIAGNLYYVGANDVAAFLLAGPEGHVLIDGGYPGTAPLIMASIAKLGFDIKDVKVLLNSEPHYDHAGGLAELQQASGAALWASEASADAIAAGGDDPYATTPAYTLLVKSGLLKYPAPRVDHRFQDGAKIRLGATELAAHVTGGHSRGCTTWTFPVREGGRTLQVVSACSLTLLPGMRLVEPQRYPGIRADFERTFGVLRSLPADIWVTAHARDWGRYRKFSESRKAKDPVQPFLDREGYLAYIDKGEARVRKLLEEQQRER
jgi:metallo-beta-lactamase class B